MKIDRVIVGDLETNCYIVSKNNNCIVIDPGDEYNKIKKHIGNKNIIGVFVTHYHFDHIGALKYFDKNLIYDRYNLEEKEYNISDFCFEIIYTPGHKDDSITIYFKKQNIMFTGDFIFKGAIGRTDLPKGDINEMIKSLNKIKSYPKDTIIYPGHGEYTKLLDEF